MRQDDTFDWRRYDARCVEAGARARERRRQHKTLRVVCLVCVLAAASMAAQLLILWLYRSAA